jgi:thiol:disulfide interchange protein DsbC
LELLRLFILVITLFPVCLIAAEPDLTHLRAALQEWAPPESVESTPVPGLYEVIVNGQVLYLSEDGQFAVLGNLIDLSTSTNLTEARRGQMRIKAIEAVGEDNMVIFSPPTPAKHTITVFTDVDCVYCRRLHQDIASYLDKGIEVRYLMFPRPPRAASGRYEAPARRPPVR